MISAAERAEFQLVVQHAKLEGWLAKSDSMTACEVDTCVQVKCQGRALRTKSYPHDARWPYELLRDLAHGLWRACQRS